MPLDAFRHSSDDYLDLQLAAWQLISDCVQRFGAEYTVSEAAVADGVPPAFFFGNERRYGLFDAGSASQHGYHLPPEGLDPGRKEEGWNPSESELVLVRGSDRPSTPTDGNGQPLPDGGCIGEANRILLIGVPNQRIDEALPNTLAGASFEQSEADSRVRNVMKQWSECMDRSGLDYDNIWEPNDETWPEPVSEEEVAVASADVTCKQEVNLVGIWLAVESAYQDRAIREHTTELNNIANKLSIEHKNAARIVGRDRQSG